MSPEPVLCLVTERALVPVSELPALADLAARAGIDIIQIRERDLPDGELVTLVREIVAATEGTPARVVVNDRADIAIAGGAAGVHLRSDSVAASRVRAFVPAGFLVGRSVHTIAEATGAESDGGCDYLVFGTVFRSASKPADHPACGTEQLRRVCDAVRLPVLAIGGICVENAAEVARAGAAGVAAIRLFSTARDLAGTISGVRGRLAGDRA